MGVREGLKKMWIYPHLLLTHPSTTQMLKKQKNMLFFWLFSSFGTKKILKFFHLATHHSHPLEPSTAATKEEYTKE